MASAFRTASSVIDDPAPAPPQSRARWRSDHARSQMVALDGWSIAPVGAGETHSPTTGRLNEAGAIVKPSCGRARSARRLPVSQLELLQHQAEIGRMVREATRQEHFRLHGVAVRRAVGILPCTCRPAGTRTWFLQVLPDSGQVGDHSDAQLLQLFGVADAESIRSFAL